MHYVPKYRIIYGKEDINKKCKFCQKINHKTFSHGCAYGYECKIKSEKRKMKKCSICYFGINKLSYC